MGILSSISISNPSEQKAKRNSTIRLRATFTVLGVTIPTDTVSITWYRGPTTSGPWTLLTSSASQPLSIATNPSQPVVGGSPVEVDISTGDTFEREYIIATGKADADMVGDAQWSEPVGLKESSQEITDAQAS